MRDVLVAVLVVAITAAGCSKHGHHGHLVAEYPVDTTGHSLRPRPTLGWTTTSAVYVLFARQKPAGWQDAKKVRGGWELGSWRLPKRSKLGFKRAPDGTGVIAVAGRDETTLPPGRYCWHAKMGSTPIDWGATALVGVLIVGALFGAYVAWWYADFHNNPLGGGPLLYW